MTDTLVCTQLFAAAELPPAMQATRTAYIDALERLLAGTSFNTQTPELVNFEVRMDISREIRQARSGHGGSDEHNVCSPGRAGKVLEIDGRGDTVHSVVVDISVS